MRRGVWLVVLGVLAAALGVASAQAAGSETTTTGTTSTTTTTTTTTTPSYSPLASSSLPAGCIGAGAAALVLPAHPVIALGTPASGLGPSAYPSSGSVLAFDSSTAGGATCKAGRITLGSVSLFGGVITASSVQATDGRGTATGLEIDGTAVTASAGETVSVEGWGQLTFGSTIGRVTAPLVLRLLQAHDSLPAGTAVVVAFAASARPAAKPKAAQQQQAAAEQKHVTGASQRKKSSGGKHQSKKHSRRQGPKRTLNFPASSYPFLAGGRLAPGTKHNGVVSLALHYLGIPYLWGGASPKTGFDCSGLVKYVFAKFGVYLPHYAASQFRAPGSVWIPPDRLQPGDLVFFVGSDGTRKAPGHVGIYVDDGYIIDAPHTGAFVRIDKLSERGLADGYVGAKRIVGASLVARHLAHATKDATSVHVLPLMLAPQVTGRASAASLPLIATDSTAERTSPPRNYGLWTGAVLGGVLLLVAAAGAVTYRRRERAPQP
jgi:cell wall-associated NlpC family hydrolase